mgnify:FL=1
MQVIEELRALQRLTYMMLITQQQAPVTNNSTAVAGNTISSTAGSGTELYKNSTSRPQSVIVFGDFADDTSGVIVRLSKSPQIGADQAVDYVGNTALAPAFNNRFSRIILLNPSESIYGLSTGSGSLVAGDAIRMRVVDYTTPLSSQTWRASDFTVGAVRKTG